MKTYWVTCYAIRAFDAAGNFLGEDECDMQASFTVQAGSEDGAKNKVLGWLKYTPSRVSVCEAREFDME